MLIPKQHECLLALLIIPQAAAFMKGCRIRTTKSLSFRDSFSSIYHESNHRVLNQRLMAVTDPFTAESSSSSSSSSFGKSKMRPTKTAATQKRPRNNRRRKHMNATKKPRRDNPAMGDTAFLRKRTAELLADSDSTSNNSQNRGGSMKVKTKNFHFLIDAWAFSGELDAADQALKLLDRMEELQEENESSSVRHNNVRPDVRSYTKVINAVSRSMRQDAGEIAESILEKMEYLHSSGKNSNAKPNTFTYTAVIEAYTNSGAEGSAEKGEELLDTMIEKYEGGDVDIQPTARSFNAVINAYGKSGYPGAAQQAEYLFDRMGDLYMSGVSECKPNTFNYNSLITALANSAEEGSAERAAEFLDRMEQCYKAGDPNIKPTTLTFNAVINGFAKHGNAQRAEEILLYMEKLYEAGEDIKPNTRSFNSVINAWAKSPREDAAQHAQDLFDFMNGLYKKANKSLRPDVHSFCTVINGMLFLYFTYILPQSKVISFLFVFSSCLVQHGAVVMDKERQNMQITCLKQWSNHIKKGIRNSNQTSLLSML